MVKFLLEYDEDKNAWSTFASCLRSIPLEWSKKGFQILFDRFPYSGLFVRMYCEKEEEANHLEEVKEVSFHYYFKLRFLRRDYLVASALICGCITATSLRSIICDERWEESY